MNTLRAFAGDFCIDFHYDGCVTLMQYLQWIDRKYGRNGYIISLEIDNCQFSLCYNTVCCFANDNLVYENYSAVPLHTFRTTSARLYQDEITGTPFAYRSIFQTASAELYQNKATAVPPAYCT